MTRWLCLWVCILCGCGGSSAASERDPSDPRRQAALERLAKEQQAMCTALCPRLTECALETSRGSVSAKELQELEDPQFLAAYTAKCQNECVLRDNSMRQVHVGQACAAGKSTCAEFLDCLEAAKPRPQAP